jgi:hypothetical protein
MKDNVVVIFPSVFSANKIANLQSSIKNALEANNIKCKDIFLDDSLIIADVDDAVVASSVITDLFGVEKVAVANKTSNKFSDLVGAIVDVGKKIIHPAETFAIKVDSNRTEYVGRDVEFAATASLIGELSKMNVKAVSAQNCDKLIHAYASQSSAYVCIFIDKGLHGLALGSQNEQLLCSLHSNLSALSCLMTIKCGFDPKVVLLKTSEEEFRETAKNIEFIAKRLGKKKMQLIVAHVDIVDNGSRPLVIEKVASMILGKLCAVHNIKNIALPLSIAVFPSWFISEVVSDVAKVAVPWLPLMFMSDELYTNANALGLKDFKVGMNGTGKASYDADEYAQFVKTINLHDLVDRAMKSVKTIDLEIGPNYLNDIIDS